MEGKDILKYRLINQQIAATKFSRPEEIVAWLGAMQGQEFAMAKWAIGLRLPGIKESDVDKAFNEGKILRTHLMRPTWHLVSPQDIRWLLALTAPRIKAINAYWEKKAELDDKIFQQCNDLFIKQLEGNSYLNREQLKAALAGIGIKGDTLRMSLIFMHAELGGLICSGPRVGKQFTYALLEERVPTSPTLNMEEALITLARCYFNSRGPATLPDFATWSGLSAKDARVAMDAIKNEFIMEKLGENEYIFPANQQDINMATNTAFLMPDYDEYVMGYKDRSTIFAIKSVPVTSYNHMVVIDGIVEAIWVPSIKSKTASVEIQPFIPLNKAKQKEVDTAVKRYIAFLGKGDM